MDSATRSSVGLRARHGPHHDAQKSTTTGTSRERSITALLEAGLVDVGRHLKKYRPRARQLVFPALPVG